MDGPAADSGVHQNNWICGQTKAKKLEFTNKYMEIIGNTGNISNWNGRNKGDGLASGWFPQDKILRKNHSPLGLSFQARWKMKKILGPLATLGHIRISCFYLTFWLAKSKMHQLTCVPKTLSIRPQDFMLWIFGRLCRPARPMSGIDNLSHTWGVVCFALEFSMPREHDIDNLPRLALKNAGCP